MAVSGEHKDGAQSVIIISGPTASGKSFLAIELAKLFSGEIISADSRQIFRQLKIGTDRLDENEWQGIPHYFMGSHDLGERFTAFDFARGSERLIGEIHGKNNLPVVCGGTGLYIRALVDGIFEIPEDDMSYRQELLDIATRQGPKFIFDMLSKIDPEEASRIHPQNMIKVIRALEIHHITGIPKSELMRKGESPKNDYRYLHIILLPDREQVYKRIEARVDQMIELGLVDEARRVFGATFSEALRQSKIVGYSELIDHFEDRISLAEAIRLIKQNTRRYAKRQYTWFRAVKRAKKVPYFGREAVEMAQSLVREFLPATTGE